MNRREFIKKSIKYALTMPLFLKAMKSKEAFASDLPIVDESSGKAKIFAYIHDESKVDLDKYPKKKNQGEVVQTCENCQLLTKPNSKEDKDGKWGLCALFPGELVNHKGWCNSWVKKV